MHVIKEENARPIKAWVGTKEMSIEEAFQAGFEKRYNPRHNAAGDTVMCDVPDIEDGALQQAKNLARLPFIAGNGVALMPDVHFGIGASVGTVIATHKAIIPSAVGVDIGCGMNAVRLSLKASDLPESLLAIRHQIERDVPTGNAQHKDQNYIPEGHGDLHPLWKEFHDNFSGNGVVTRDFDKAWFQLGTLGGGNHFIELCLDENQDVWVMLHSGSRGIGNQIGRNHIEVAQKLAEQFFIDLPHRDLAYLPEGTEQFEEYVAAVQWAQNYALENRRQMMILVLAALKRHIPVEFDVTSEAINCHHNYVEKENHFGQNLWVTRKGAIRAREGDLGIIPGSMGQQSYIVRGKGNPESYCSCSHGAGRAMSRAEAKRRFSLADLVEQTQGVECRKDADVIDEIPGSYKRLDVVMANQADLVEVVHTLKAILCVKGN